MAHFTKQSDSNLIKITVSQYCERYNITRNAVFRRINGELPNGNILSKERVGERLFLLTVDKTIPFKRRKTRRIKK